MTTTSKGKKPTAAVGKKPAAGNGAAATPVARALVRKSPIGKVAAKSAAVKKASATARAGAMPMEPPIRIRPPLHRTVKEFVDTITKGLKAANATPKKKTTSTTAEVSLPKKLTPFEGWKSNPSEQEIQEVIKARSSLFSTDHS